MLFEIVNPSDAYTIEAPDRTIAAVACLVLGSGHLAFRPVEDDKMDAEGVPLFVFGGMDAWCKRTFGMDAQTLVDKVLSARRDDVARCLESCLIGDHADRKEFEEACALIADEAKCAAFRASRHDRRRSSLSDIGGEAARLAAALRKPAKPNQKASPR